MVPSLVIMHFQRAKSKMEKMRKQKKMTTERNGLTKYATIAGEKDIQVKIAKKENIIIRRKMRKQRRLFMGMKTFWYYVCL